jgi:hypothetical protein
MFYEGLGRLLAHASEALNDEVRPHVGEDAARTQLDAVAALCADIGAMWPILFEALNEETRILADVVDPPGSEADSGLSRYDTLLRRMNEELDALEGTADDGRREELRGAMAAAAAVQQRVVERAAATSASAVVKRI